ncbi:MAG: tyrosine-protein phosphatase [Lentisphaeria bacterium]|nr:tyrosine-protein phosphatase [Lentisphaeria bacterium]
MIRKMLSSFALLVFSCAALLAGEDAAPKEENCCLLLSDDSPVISQRTGLQNRLYEWHDRVAKMLKSEDEMKKDDVPDEAKKWMELMHTEGLELSRPKPLVCLWDNRGGKKQAIRVEIAEDKDFRTGVMSFRPEKGHDSVEIHSMKSGQKYYLRLRWTEDQAGKCSQTLTFSTAAECPRWIRVDGVSNVRDFGGWKTVSGKRIRQGLLFRGGQINGPRPATPSGIEMLLDNLKVKTDIDLRGVPSAKRPYNGMPALPEDRVKHHRFSLGGYAGIFIPKQRALYKDVFRLIIQPGVLPAYIHCVGGADRTGTIIFLLQGVLKVPEEEMLRAYELTSMFSFYRGNRYRGRKAFMAFRQQLREQTGETDLHKQCEKYFLDCGVTPDEIAAFRKIFLED